MISISPNIKITFSNFQLTVRATDKGIRPRHSEESVSITILREGNPSFDSSEYPVTKAESVPVGETIYQLSANDPLNVSLVKFLLPINMLTTWRGLY